VFLRHLLPGAQPPVLSVQQGRSWDDEHCLGPSLEAMPHGNGEGAMDEQVSASSPVHGGRGDKCCYVATLSSGDYPL
jgi:hypothetical protein